MGRYSKTYARPAPTHRNDVERACYGCGCRYPVTEMETHIQKGALIGCPSRYYFTCQWCRTARGAEAGAAPPARREMNQQTRAAEQRYALYLSRDKTADELRALGKFADTPRTRRIMRLALSLKREMNSTA